MKHTCGMWDHVESGICGKPAVDHIDIPAPGLKFVRLYLCAYHADQRAKIEDDCQVELGLEKHKWEHNNRDEWE